MNIGTIILIVVIIILLYWLISSYIVNKNILTFICNGDIGEKEIQYKEKEGGIAIEWEEHVKLKIVQTIYELK